MTFVVLSFCFHCLSSACRGHRRAGGRWVTAAAPALPTPATRGFHTACFRGLCRGKSRAAEGLGAGAHKALPLSPPPPPPAPPFSCLFPAACCSARLLILRDRSLDTRRVLGRRQASGRWAAVGRRVHQRRLPRASTVFAAKILPMPCVCTTSMTWTVPFASRFHCTHDLDLLPFPLDSALCPGVYTGQTNCLCGVFEKD